VIYILDPEQGSFMFVDIFKQRKMFFFYNIRVVFASSKLDLVCLMSIIKLNNGILVIIKIICGERGGGAV